MRRVWRAYQPSREAHVGDGVAGGVSVRFHVDCYHVWDSERRAVFRDKGADGRIDDTDL
jgi:hypothetical protein